MAGRETSETVAGVVARATRIRCAMAMRCAADGSALVRSGCAVCGTARTKSKERDISARVHPVKTLDRIRIVTTSPLPCSRGRAESRDSSPHCQRAGGSLGASLVR